MIRSDHTLIHASDAGNGYHGYCEHCGIPLVTDLGYCSWDNTICDSGPKEKREKEYALEAKVYPILQLAFEYFRFKENWAPPFTKEGWYEIRGTADPQFNEVRRACKKHDFDSYSSALVKHILSNCGTGDNVLMLKKNKLVFKHENK